MFAKQTTDLQWPAAPNIFVNGTGFACEFLENKAVEEGTAERIFQSPPCNLFWLEPLDLSDGCNADFQGVLSKEKRNK